MSFKKAVKSRIKQWLDADAPDGVGGVKVISGSAGVLTVESFQDGRRQATLAGMSGTVGEAVLELKESGLAWVEVKMGGRVVHAASATQEVQVKVFDHWIRSFGNMARGSKSGGGWIFRWAVLICAVLLAMVWFGLRAQALTAREGAAAGSGAPPAAFSAAPLSEVFAQVQQQQQQAAQRGTTVPTVMPGGLPPPAEEDKIYAIEKLSSIKLDEVKTANLLKTKSSGKPFYVFSNPTCGACHDLETQLNGLKGEEQPVIIPVAFDAEGMRMGTAVMCSADPVSAWKAMMKDGRTDAPLCLDGLKKMETNSKMFASLGFQATPTIVAADGRGAIGSVSSGVLAAWLADTKSK